MLFGNVVCFRNLLISFDDFTGNEFLPERDLQDYPGRYQALRDEWKHRRERGEAVDITENTVFEVELVRQIEINMDYILMLVKKYHDTNSSDREVLITIRKAMNASPELRSKKQFIEDFVADVHKVDDVLSEWNTFVIRQRRKDLAAIIRGERLKPEETCRFLDNSFRDGEIKTVGTDIDRLKAFFEKYSGAGAAAFTAEEKPALFD